MNKNDSEVMIMSMEREGFVHTENLDDSDIAIYNTCSVRSHAETRVLARMRLGKKRVRGKKGILAVTGCMAQRMGSDLVKKGLADIAVGPYESPDIGGIIRLFLNGRGKNVFTSQEAANFHDRIMAEPGGFGDASWHRWVTITHGCENFCSYCIVPYVRGKLISFKSDTILSYIKTLAETGTKEITLLGQNVNQYGTDSGDIPFHRLLEKAAAVRGLIRINFITSHPKDFSPDIIKIIRDNGNISRSIHLPLQSGSDRILTLMNRNYDMSRYMGIVELIHRNLESYSLTTDIITGFPGETADDFDDTLACVRRIRFDDAFMYSYSPRENTPAAGIQEDLSGVEKLQRLNRLIAIQRGISREKLLERLNMHERIIVECISKKSRLEVMGKTFLNHPVVIPGNKEDIGKDFIVTIKNLKGNTLQGIRLDR